jgi:DNA-binding CsgD family transcriptional regulator
MPISAMTTTFREPSTWLTAESGGPRASSSGVPLSRRERETALLAAQGASNAQIAEALYVSTRTVECHLYAAFRKLGITRRHQLAQALRDN